MNAQNADLVANWPAFAREIAQTLIDNCANPMVDAAEAKFVQFAYLHTKLTTNEVALTIVERRQAPHTL